MNIPIRHVFHILQWAIPEITGTPPREGQTFFEENFGNSHFLKFTYCLYILSFLMKTYNENSHAFFLAKSRTCFGNMHQKC